MDELDLSRQWARCLPPTQQIDPDAVALFNVANTPPDPRDTTGALSELGFYIRRKAREAGYSTDAHLARVAEIHGSTLSRLMKDGGTERPKMAVLDRLSEALGLDPDELRGMAGYVTTANIRRYHPYAVELDQMLGDDSPLSAEDKAYLGVMVDKLIGPFRPQIYRRTG